MKRRLWKKHTGNNFSQEKGQKEETLTSNLDQTLNVFKKIYTYPKNSDFTIRELRIGALNKQASILFISSITKVENVNQFIVDPLIKNEKNSNSVEDIITTASMEQKNTFKDVMKEINNGIAALFIDGDNQAYIFNVSEFESRGIEKPDNESVVKGPKEAFSEKVSTNISLVRKRVRNESLVVERSTISKGSNNDVYMLYVSDITNEQLLNDVKERLNELDTDAIQNLSLLEQYIEDRKYSIFPSILYTERPDRAASFLEDGYIVLLMDNSPDSLVVPATFWSMFHSSEDHYLRFLYANFTRLLRIFARYLSPYSLLPFMSLLFPIILK
ncbi:spore germination protein [Virgibacillus kimchii]